MPYSEKIIIDYANMKRELNFPFNVCGSGEMLRSLANQILRQADEGLWYGWVYIVDPSKAYMGVPNQQTRSWIE